MHMLHPSKPLRRLDLLRRRECIGIVERRRLNVDNPRKNLRVPVEQPTTAVRAETAHNCSRRVNGLRNSFRQYQGSFREHCPCNHWRACATSAVAAMANGHGRGFAQKLILNCATQTSSSVSHHGDSLEFRRQGHKVIVTPNISANAYGKLYFRKKS